MAFSGNFDKLTYTISGEMSYVHQRTAWTSAPLPSEKSRFEEVYHAHVDQYTERLLKRNRIINWCPLLSTLYPIRTFGDGNCLLYATSIYLCCSSQYGYNFRQIIHDNMSKNPIHEAIRQRWKVERERQNAAIPNGGLQFTDSEWDREWEMTVKLAGSDVQYAEHYNVRMMQYQYLEQVHVFVLANILRRPIIVVGEPFLSGSSGETLEQNDFVGIYLPIFHLPSSCHRSPIVLAFIVDHFLPLHGRYTDDRESKTIDAVPLVSSSLEPLRIHFLLDDEQGAMANHLLQQYMSTFEIEMSDDESSPSSTSMILCAGLSYSSGFYRDDMLMVTPQPLAVDTRNRLTGGDGCMYCSMASMLIQRPGMIPEVVGIIMSMRYALTSFQFLVQHLPSAARDKFLKYLDNMGDERFTSETVLAGQSPHKAVTRRRPKKKTLLYCRWCYISGTYCSRHRPPHQRRAHRCPRCHHRHHHVTHDNYYQYYDDDVADDFETVNDSLSSSPSGTNSSPSTQVVRYTTSARIGGGGDAAASGSGAGQDDPASGGGSTTKRQPPSMFRLTFLVLGNESRRCATPGCYGTSTYDDGLCENCYYGFDPVSVGDVRPRTAAVKSDRPAVEEGDWQRPQPRLDQTRDGPGEPVSGSHVQSVELEQTGSPDDKNSVEEMPNAESVIKESERANVSYKTDTAAEFPVIGQEDEQVAGKTVVTNFTSGLVEDSPVASHESAEFSDASQTTAAVVPEWETGAEVPRDSNTSTSVKSENSFGSCLSVPGLVGEDVATQTCRADSRSTYSGPETNKCIAPMCSNDVTDNLHRFLCHSCYDILKQANWPFRVVRDN